jgi:hypothetical protein
MRNAAILLLLILATIAVWGVASAFLVAPLLHVGQSYPLYLNLVTVPDLVGLIVYAVWAFALAWLSTRLLSVRLYRTIAVAFVILFFLLVRGVFIPGNLHSVFLVREIVLAVVITVVAFLGVFTATSNHAIQRTTGSRDS